MVAITILTYVAAIVFLVGFVYRTVNWYKVPSPIKIPVFPGTYNKGQGALHVLKDVLFFRTLLRFGDNQRLWLFSYIFHVSFLFIILRHLRYFLTPIPGWVNAVQDFGILAGYIIFVPLLYLFIRRIVNADLRFISTPADYVALLLILGIVSSGLLMKLTGVDVVAIKYYIQTLLVLSPSPEPVGLLFKTHLILVDLLAIYIPFSKIMHMTGIFFSPTRTHDYSSAAHIRDFKR